VTDRLQEVRELVSRAADALNRADVEAYVAVTHPEVEFQSLIAEAEGETFRGHEGVRRWWKTVHDAFGEVTWEFLSVDVVDDDQAILSMRIVGVLGGVPVEQTMWMALRLRDNRAWKWRFYRTEEEARAALAAQHNP
jgi:ketosteroid isomerase-like protein